MRIMEHFVIDFKELKMIYKHYLLQKMLVLKVFLLLCSPVYLSKHKFTPPSSHQGDIYEHSVINGE